MIVDRQIGTLSSSSAAAVPIAHRPGSQRQRWQQWWLAELSGAVTLQVPVPPVASHPRVSLTVPIVTQRFILQSPKDSFYSHRPPPCARRTWVDGGIGLYDILDGAPAHAGYLSASTTHNTSSEGVV